MNVYMTEVGKVLNSDWHVVPQTKGSMESVISQKTSIGEITITELLYITDHQPIYSLVVKRL